VNYRRILPQCLVFLTIAALGAKLCASQTSSRTRASAHGVSQQKKNKRKPSRRVLRIHQAFAASKNLRPMAQQLLQERTPAAYRGVEAYARLHNVEDAGALAWFVVAYAHMLDHSPAEALEPLRRAQANANELADYVTYYRASALQQTGSFVQAEVLLRDFESKFSGSIFTRDVHVTRAHALIALERPAEAVAILEADRQPVRADVEVTLGRAYAAARQSAKAVAALRTVFYGMPMAPEADEAEKELLTLSGKAPPATIAERKTRVDLLVKGKRYTEAVTEYHALIGDSSPPDRLALEVALAAALRLGGRNREAKQLLESLSGATADVAAQRLFNLGEIARAADEDATFQDYLLQLRQTGPQSQWLEQALFSSANKFLVNKDYLKAEALYRELAQRFPAGSHGSYAHWKSAWLLWRQGQGAEARREFEQQIMLFPEGAETAAALYWRGRAAEDDGEPGRARAYYEKLVQRHRSYYYGLLAGQRLKTVGSADIVAVEPALANLHVPEPRLYPASSDPPADSLRVQKANLLVNGALLDFALRELHIAALEEGGSWEIAEMARLCQDAGRYDRALDVVKHEVPSYFAGDVFDLPPPYWQALFPRPYWVDLKKYATENSLDPYLVAALIRQESAFNPSVISHANAVGLMQLLPSTGRRVAKDLKIRGFAPAMLTIPSTNLRLGTKYFRGMVDQFDAVEYALAAYNAGSDRVQDWQAAGKYRDIPEFVESIPFTETREYVQAIQRNASVYRQLYGAP
jgi:soluble lytic murein transglycosylase